MQQFYAFNSCTTLPMQKGTERADKRIDQHLYSSLTTSNYYFNLLIGIHSSGLVLACFGTGSNKIVSSLIWT